MLNRPPPRRISFPCPTHVQKTADGADLLTGSDFEAWRGWRRVLLRSPNELHEAFALEGRVAPHTKRKPRCYARLIRDMSLRGLVSFGPPSEIFDSRRVFQHVRRPWHCALPSPASWVGLQLPVNSTYHMAQTDVNNAFFRILAPPGMSEYFILPSVSTQLLLREGVDVPDHLLHLSDVSPQLQVLAMGVFLGFLFSADALLLDRHRAPAMTRDSICFGVCVDGVCAVGCSAVKVALDAAGLQCYEVEAYTSKQVFTGLPLDHKTGVLSLEASRIWRFRRGLEYAARQRHLTGDHVAKLIGHITWSCLLRRLALSLINVGYVVARTFGPRSGRVLARSCPGIPLDCVITAASHLQSCQSLVAMGLCHGCLWWRPRRPWCYASQM